MYLFLLGILIVLYPFSSHADNVVNIGGLVTTLKSNTSCDLKYWKTDANSCTCCLVKHTMEGRKTYLKEDTINYCTKKKHCSNQIIQLLNNRNLSQTQFLEVLTRTAIENPKANIQESNLQKGGKLTPEGVKSLLATAVKDNIIGQSEHRLILAQKHCLQIKEIGGGGAQTAQLFLIGVDQGCLNGRNAGKFYPTYILKETKKQVEEVANLRKVAQSELKEFDLFNPKRNEDGIALAFDVQNFVYKSGNREHYLTLLVAAPGQSIMSLSQRFAEEIKKEREHKENNYKEMYNQVYQSFYKLGYGLSKLHRKFMVSGAKLLTKSMTHNDLHMENIFVDPSQNYLITLIDNETFAKGVKDRISVTVDLLLLYGSSIAHYAEKRHPTEIPESIWHQVMFEPFIKGYIQAWPLSQQLEVWKELRDIYLNGMPTLKLVGGRVLAIDPIVYKKISTKYASSIFTRIAQDLNSFKW